MDEFVSTFTNKVDAKGRVSVPASFRAVLTKEGSDEIFIHPALDNPALDAGGPRLVKHIRTLLKDLAPYSDEKDQLATALFGESEYLKIDNDGRIILPIRLRQFSNIQQQITFVGLGDKFQLWSPDAFEIFRQQARGKVKKIRALLGATSEGAISVAYKASGGKEPRE